MKKDMGELLQGLASWLDVHQEEFFEDVASLVEIPSLCASVASDGTPG